MTGPGDHELSAECALRDARIEEAQVLALLAIASAVNRLADALEFAGQSDR